MELRPGSPSAHDGDQAFGEGHNDDDHTHEGPLLCQPLHRPPQRLRRAWPRCAPPRSSPHKRSPVPCGRQSYLSQPRALRVVGMPGDFKPRNMKRWQRNAGYKNPPTPYVVQPLRGKGGSPAHLCATQLVFDRVAARGCAQVLVLDPVPEARSYVLLRHGLAGLAAAMGGAAALCDQPGRRGARPSAGPFVHCGPKIYCGARMASVVQRAHACALAVRLRCGAEAVHPAPAGLASQMRAQVHSTVGAHPLRLRPRALVQLGELGAPVESSSDEMDEKKEENGRPGDDAAADSGSGVVAGAAGQRLQQEAEQKKREALIADLHGPEPGDWRVIVHVLQVRQMLPAERHAQVSPTVKMKCFGKTRNTRIANGRPVGA